MNEKQQYEVISYDVSLITYATSEEDARKHFYKEFKSDIPILEVRLYSDNLLDTYKISFDSGESIVIKGYTIEEAIKKAKNSNNGKIVELKLIEK